MNYDSGPIRTPFRPLHQQMYSNTNKDRLKDSPMDYAYDTPTQEDSHANSSSWLNVEEDRKRPRDAIDNKDIFAFGAKGNSGSTNGAFLFHQPISPTIAGPDVEMSTDTTPKKDVVAATKEGEDLDQEDSTGRPISSGALTRVTRSRGGNGKRANTTASEQPRKARSNSQNRNRKKGRAVEQNNDWEDEDEVERPKSLRSRMGDTMNIQYVFGGESGTHSGRTNSPSWLDPEWCLGMAQFAFNAPLLLGALWLIISVVRTLQRDVADKVREYELEFLSEIEACSHSFHLNRCGTDGAVPALATACASWQKCSAKDPAIVGRARVAAETVAEIVNGFVDVVSWKSMIFTLLSLIIVVGATNSTLSFFRLRSRKSPANIAQPNAVPYDAAYNNAMYHHPYPAHWHASPPSTPSTKRMCR